MKQFAVLLLAIGSLTACSATDNTDAGIAFAAGSYDLTSINGQPLPFTEQTGTPVIKVTGSQLEARKDKTFTQTVIKSTTTSSGTTTATIVSNGTYSVGGQVVSFTFAGTGVSALGSHTQTMLTMPVGSATYEYTKR